MVAACTSALQLALLLCAAAPMLVCDAGGNPKLAKISDLLQHHLLQLQEVGEEDSGGDRRTLDYLLARKLPLINKTAHPHTMWSSLKARAGARRRRCRRAPPPSPSLSPR